MSHLTESQGWDRSFFFLFFFQVGAAVSNQNRLHSRRGICTAGSCTAVARVSISFVPLAHHSWPPQVRLASLCSWLLWLHQCKTRLRITETDDERLLLQSAMGSPTYIPH
ncbi:hypothetical protein BJ166DRAFT_255471 [Pestalotiopsis sp. NC0098]|nr:hypothetical protein BJ166DRAFT_255471 [Pestalotiopsis sp. NC0098]